MPGLSILSYLSILSWPENAGLNIFITSKSLAAIVHA